MKQLSVRDKDDIREDLLYLSEETWDALQSMYAPFVEEDFTFDGTYHEFDKFDLIVDTVDAEEAVEGDYDSLEEAIEVLNSF